MAFKVSFIKNKQGRKEDRPVAGILSLLLSLFILTACPSVGPTCIDADEWGQSEDITIRIDPKKKFNPSGISVRSGEPLSVETSGVVDLCPTSVVVGAASTTHPITPARSGWQDSGQRVTVGERFVLLISATSGYTDRNGPQTSGKGLYAYIIPDNPTLTNSLAAATTDAARATANAAIAKDLSDKIAVANGEWWYGEANANAPATNRLAMDDSITCHKISPSTNCNSFFELWDNGTTGSGGSGFAGIAPVSGKLYFRYARTADARGMKSGESSPWKGAYRWAGSRCEACRQTTIMGACTGALMFYGACVAGWQAGCAGSNHLERAPGTGERPNADYRKSKCQEWYSVGSEKRTGGYWGNNGFDHFVDENSGKAPNGDDIYNGGTGYEISISHGCWGTHGKYMQMDIGSSSAVTVNSTTQTTCATGATACTVGAHGCTEGSAGCQVDRDPFSQAPITEAKFSVSAISKTNMNSSGVNPNGTFADPTLPPGFTRRGLYETPNPSYLGGAPASGELWFEILDTATEQSDANPNGAYYHDNEGSYDVRIKTTKVDTNISGLLNGIVNPMRKIIFGYCRDSASGVDQSKNTEAECFPKTTVDANGTTITGAWKPGITQRMYNVLVTNAMFVNSVRAAMVLVIVVYGMLFMMGMINDLKENVLKKIIKLAIISQLIGPNSWLFFNQYLFTVFIDGMNSLIGVLAGDFMGVGSAAANVTNPFAFIDATMSKFLNFSTLAKLLGLLFSSPLGIMYVILMLAGIFYFLLAVLRAAILYILSMLTISLLLVVAPIFISLMMFERTKGYFDNWIKSLINYLFQPVLVFTALSIFNVFVYSSIYTLLHYSVCWTDVISFKVDFGLGEVPISLFKFYMPDGGHDGGRILDSGMPIGFFMILIFIIITNAMLKFVNFMAELAAHLTTGAKDTALSGAAAASLSSSFAAGKKAIGVVKGGAGALAKKVASAKKGSGNKTARK